MHLSACSRTLFPEVAFHAKTIANKHKQKQTKSPTVCREHSKITYLQSASARIHKESSLSSCAQIHSSRQRLHGDCSLILMRLTHSVGAIFPGDGFNFRRYRQPWVKKKTPVVPEIGFPLDRCLFLTSAYSAADANCALKLRPQNRDLLNTLAQADLTELNWRDGLVLDKMCVPFMPGRACAHEADAPFNTLAPKSNGSSVHDATRPSRRTSKRLFSTPRVNGIIWQSEREGCHEV